MRREEKGEEKCEERKNPQANSGTMYHSIKHSSVKHTLPCVHVMHLVCCVGESVCATSHLPHVSPCRAAAVYETPAVRHHKENRNAFACQALQRDVWRVKKNDRVF